MYTKTNNFFLKAFVILIISFVLGGSVLFTGCSRSETKALVVGTNIWPGYEPGYLAESEGLYQSAPVSMRQFASATEVLRAFRNQLIDVAALTLDEVFQLAQYDDDVAVILVCDISDGADVIMARPEIKTINDLSGKRIAAEGTALGAFVVARALEVHDVDPQTVSVKSITVDESLVAYQNNEIDAVVTFEPFRTKLLNAGAVEIFNSKEIPNEIVDVLVARKSAINEHPALFRDFLGGWLAAVDLIHTAPEKAFPVIADRLDISTEEAELAYDGLLLPNRAANQSLLVGNEAALVATAQALNEVLVAKGLVEKRADVDALLSGQILCQLYDCGSHCRP
jgi:NitT/TauT family transport system substrate-binding protein